MPALAFTYLVMTDGTDTVTFSDGTGALPGWPLADTGWGPQLAGLRTSPLGGRGPYADVEELITCNIIGTTAALCYANLDTLARLLDKAERWWLRNEPISPVLLKYVPQGSTIHSIATPMQAIVLGRVGTAELNGVALPKNYDDAGMLFEIDGVEVACLRRGGWTGAEDTASSGAAVANPSLMTMTLGAHPLNSVLSIAIGGFDKTTTPTIQAGYLVVSSATSGIQIVEAEAATSASYTSVADAANNARGTNVLRFTPAVTVAVTSGTISGLSTVGGMIAILAAVRNNSATTTFLVQANMTGLGTIPSTTPPTLIDTSSTQPRLILLGTLNTAQANKLSFTVQASAASGTFDIDYVIVVMLQDETCAIIAHDAVALSNLGAGAASLDFVFDPTFDQSPKVQVSGTGGSIPVGYRGPLPLITAGTKVYAVWTATNGASWRFTTTAPAVMNTTAQAVRDKSYVSPQ